jgi:hypothetical protein
MVSNPSIVANRLMRYVIVVSLGILIGTRGAFALQDNPESAILTRAAAAVRKAEPEWRFIRGILNAPPLMDEQLGAAAGGWYRSLDDPSTAVDVEVYRITTAEAAAGWLYREAHGDVHKGWIVTPYELGDGANMATLVDPSQPTQYGLAVRKGRFLARIHGRSIGTVDRFAQFLLAEMLSMSNRQDR